MSGGAIYQDEIKSCFRFVRDVSRPSAWGANRPVVAATGVNLLQGHIYVEGRELKTRRNKVPPELSSRYSSDKK